MDEDGSLEWCVVGRRCMDPQLNFWDFKETPTKHSGACHGHYASGAPCKAGATVQALNMAGSARGDLGVPTADPAPVH